MTNSRTPLNAVIGTVLCRAVVPLWVVTGAVFKIIERDPTLLPKNIVDATKTVAKHFEEPTAVLDFVLRSLIGLEFLAVVLMVLVAKAARPVALFMLGVFCLILIGEMVAGNFEQCGCFGNLPIAPWQMLIADGGLLLGVIFFRPTAVQPFARSRWPAVAALVCVLAGFGTSFGMPGRTVIGPKNDTPGVAPPSPATVPALTANCPPLPPAPATLEGLYWPIYERWIGQCWTQTELAPLAGALPPNFEKDKWYVVLYRKDCEHCHKLLERFFTGALSIPTLAIAVPEREGFPDPFDEIPMPCTECILRDLAVGPDYAIQTPAVVLVEDGIVQCAAEVDSAAELPECIEQ